MKLRFWAYTIYIVRALLIEDEQGIIDFLKAGLESEYFVVDVAMDGEQGSSLARTNSYDIIILDNMLPKKNGGIVCEEVRQAGKTTPIIMLSVLSETTTKTDILNKGADDYLTKPFSFEELLARIHALLRRPPAITHEVLQLDDLTLDSKKHIVKRGNKEIYLTRKEFMLLDYLLRNNGVVVSRGMLLEHVWDMFADPSSNTIESHILNLRKKIDAKGKKKLLHTISGIGYKLDIRK